MRLGLEGEQLGSQANSPVPTTTAVARVRLEMRCVLIMIIVLLQGTASARNTAGYLGIRSRDTLCAASLGSALRMSTRRSKGYAREILRAFSWP